MINSSRHRFVVSLLLVFLECSSGFYLSALLNRRLEAMIPPASPFALTESFSTAAFTPGTRTETTSVAQHAVEVAFGSIAATKDAIDDAMSRGLQTSVLGTRVVAFGSRLDLLAFVGVIADSTVRASVKWDSQPAPAVSVKWDDQPATVLL